MQKRKLITRGADIDKVLAEMTVVVILDYDDKYIGTNKEKMLTAEISGRVASLVKRYFNDLEECDRHGYEDILWIVDECVECEFDNSGICPNCGNKK